MDRWRVNILGRFELRAPAGQEVALGARKSIALLALLAAAPGQRMSRDRVAGIAVGGHAGRAGARQSASTAGRHPTPRAVSGSRCGLDRLLRGDGRNRPCRLRGGNRGGHAGGAGAGRRAIPGRPPGWLFAAGSRLRRMVDRRTRAAARACRATFPAPDGARRSNRGRAGDPLGAAHSCGRPGTRAGASSADGTLCRSGPARRRSSAIRAAARDPRARTRHSAGAGDRCARAPDPR